MPDKRVVVFVDGDWLAVRAAFGSANTWDFKDGCDPFTVWNTGKACHDFECKIDGLVDELGADDFIISFSSPVNFRKEIDPSYKANRDPEKKPPNLGDIKKHCENKYYCLEIFGIEADDVLGIYCSDKQPHEIRIMYGLDKDFQTVPAVQYRPKFMKAPAVLLDQTELEADLFHAYQTLVGDTVDGYAGLKGCGPKGAQKILDGCENVTQIWTAVRAAYAKKKVSDDICLIQARLSRILRSGDFDFATDKPILFNFPENTKPQEENEK
ncbi:hypothetical protein [Iodobacter sp.]|uniref:hypothetical protein n=1 Tax=Iodobacter sp. TaxID=1915058 RepID=UPI0025CE1486|nr:hypothetical protein [Iodobacter sp.]